MSDEGFSGEGKTVLYEFVDFLRLTHSLRRAVDRFNKHRGINYALGKCFTCGANALFDSKKYCKDHAHTQHVTITICKPLNGVNWKEIMEKSVKPAIERNML